MIVKILGNKGGGSAGAAIDYMLGKDKGRKTCSFATLFLTEEGFLFLRMSKVIRDRKK